MIDVKYTTFSVSTEEGISFTIMFLIEISILTKISKKIFIQ